MLKNSGHSVKWIAPAANQMLSAMTKRPENIFFTTVQRKALKTAEVFVTTVKRWIQGKKISRQITLWTWRLPWALSFYLKKNIARCRNWEISIPKHQAGCKPLPPSENSAARSFVIAAIT